MMLSNNHAFSNSERQSDEERDRAAAQIASRAMKSASSGKPCDEERKRQSSREPCDEEERKQQRREPCDKERERQHR